MNNTQDKKKSKRNKAISLFPLKEEEALKYLLQIKPQVKHNNKDNYDSLKK
jgi:hypothetical protein